jgi:hypothetical protein
MAQLSNAFSVMPEEIEATLGMLNGILAEFSNHIKLEAAKSQATLTSATQPAP